MSEALERSSTMNLRQLEVFHAIMVTGSVTAAADLLNVSQPAISAILKHCESRLKLKLFERTGGRLRPTREAEALFPDVAAVFGRLDAIGRLTNDLVGGRIGSLSIAAAFPIANGYLAESVASFAASRPNVTCSLQSLTSPQVLDRVINREVELGVVHEPVVSQMVDTEVLMSWSLGCVVPDTHPLARQSEVHIRDVEPYPIITYLPQIVFRPYIDRAFSDADIAPFVTMQVSIALTGIVLARFGAGVAIVDTMLVDTLGIPGVVTLPLVPQIQAKTLLISAKTAPRSLVMNDFVDHLKRSLHMSRHG
ncbi:LysR family transcriptional regulator [Rhizobium sp. P32RR-XVIII]|uniref:LysR family transcriptional regulator n=1 Tax=Rhizobium sp. P32RR-XVIII TaxID=2726738 RepID=UPI001456D97F|nr:LysR family transcriptional regulator [Rhizobium sp. P32RR-XVIII]NLS06086.1 LysR family transcriptional regulator [Rhizobium sp. P32RR-XVIII]